MELAHKPDVLWILVGRGPGGKSDRGRSWYFVHFLPQRRARMNDSSPLYVAGIIHLMLMLLEFWFVSSFFLSPVTVI